MRLHLSITQGQWQSLGRAAIVGASLLVAFGLYFGAAGSSWFEAIARWTASGTGFALDVFGISTSVSGAVLTSERFSASIAAECTSIGQMVVFTGAVAAYPSPLRAKVWGALLGIAALNAVNFVRILSLFWIGSSYPQYLDVAHMLVWQTAMALFAIFLWLLWRERMAHARHS